MLGAGARSLSSGGLLMQEGSTHAYPQGYPQGYPQAYPHGYPHGYPQAYPQGYPQGYPAQGYPPPHALVSFGAGAAHGAHGQQQLPALIQARRNRWIERDAA